MNLLKWILTLILGLGAPLLGPTHAFARETEAEILEAPQTSEAQALQVLARYPKIRIFIDEAPGNGHQAAGVLLLKRIRQMGYVGKIEMIYDEDKVEPKLEFLLPPFRSGLGVQFLPEFNVTVTNWSNRPHDVIDLALSGASEFPPKPEALFVKHLVSIHPSNWHNTPSIQSEGDLKTRFPNIKMDFPLWTAVPRPDDLAAFVEAQTAGSPRLKEKGPGLIQLLERVQNRELDLLSAYGVGLGALNSIDVLTRALLIAKTRFPLQFNKPIVVGLLSNVNPHEWTQILRNFSVDKKTNLRERVNVLNVTDADFSECLAHLSADQITYVNIGPVSQDLWHYLMDQSTLPATAAGANGISFLAQRGKPFINTTQKTSIDDNSPEGRALSELMGKVGKQFTSGGTQALLDLFLASRNSGSETAKIFRNYALHLKKKPDRVCETLLTAAPHLGQ